MTHFLMTGDCRELMNAGPADCIDAIVTDPPYGLGKTPDAREVLTHWLAGDSYQATGGGFMGKTWDSFVPGPDYWLACYRVLRPGGHMLVFGGTRTFDLLSMAIRLAGFEMRDTLAWLYASGFPKSLNISKAVDVALGAEREVVGTDQNYGRTRIDDGKTTFGDYAGEWEITVPATDEGRQWDGWGTALKPAYEPVLLCRKPFPGNVAQNVLAHGTGGLNIDATRIAGESTARTNQADMGYHGGLQAAGVGYTTGSDNGRWPANVILDEGAAAQLDAQTGKRTSTAATGSRGRRPRGMGEPGERKGDPRPNGPTYSDTGGASKYFFVAQSDRMDEWTNDPASTAEPHSSHGDGLAGSAANDVATSGSPAGTPSSGTTEPTTNETANRSNLDSETATQMTPNTGQSASPDPQLERRFPASPASPAAPNVPTGITTTTASPLPSGSSADPAMSASTPPSTAHGDQDFAGQLRYMYAPKASKAERNAGLDGMPEVLTGMSNGAQIHGEGYDRGQSIGLNRVTPKANHHPTVKPVSLMQWLCRMICPPGGMILDPFTGSGSTGVAAVAEGFNFVGMDISPDYVEIAARRIAAREEMSPDT